MGHRQTLEGKLTQQPPTPGSGYPEYAAIGNKESPTCGADILDVGYLRLDARKL